jgi:hypothetical protein
MDEEKAVQAKAKAEKPRDSVDEMFDAFLKFLQDRGLAGRFTPAKIRRLIELALQEM